MLQSDTDHDKDSGHDDALPVRRRRFTRLLEYVVAALFVAILIYVVMFTVKVADGVSRSVESPSQTVRLQVLNGCGLTGMAAEWAGKLDGYVDPEMEIRVVDTGNFDLMTVKKSFVIARAEDRAAARLIAGKVGLNPADVVYEPLGHNLQNISATLVIGQDYPAIHAPVKASKEK